MTSAFNFKMVHKNPKQLQNLQANFKKKYQAQVGVIGKTAARNDNSGLTNADVLLIHEYGSITRNIPRRSVFESLNIEEKQLINNVKKIIASDIKNDKDIYETYFKIALVMLEICKEAFYNEGYGTWSPLNPKTIENKLKGNSDAQIFTLVDTGALLNAFTFRVKKI